MRHGCGASGWTPALNSIARPWLVTRPHHRRPHLVQLRPRHHPPKKGLVCCEHGQRSGAALPRPGARAGEFRCRRYCSDADASTSAATTTRVSPHHHHACVCVGERTLSANGPRSLNAQYHGLGYFGICGIALGIAYPLMKTDEEKRKVLEAK